ncbi:8131_t:CDS:2 [Cetraspora pellucida]|uniref:8131_t:CDS:1 n=1 Tax=Cetraspora pellucida TaxID=1433469 RepID=A0A9N9NXD6_9GLOM|nr:8131_t:CDS:2 [Cetraspora pellucida]
MWKKLDESNLDQVIGFAFPLGNCSVGSIAFGGIDNRFIRGSFHNISRLNESEPFHSIKINTAYVGDIPIDTPSIDSILDTRSNRISFGKASVDFFKLINATKSPEGWKIPKPVDISFDIMLSDDEVVKFDLPSNAICDNSVGVGKDCIAVVDDRSGPLNTWIFGTPFLQNFYFAIDLKQNLIQFANRNNFCPPVGSGGGGSLGRVFGGILGAAARAEAGGAMAGAFSLGLGLFGGMFIPIDEDDQVTLPPPPQLSQTFLSVPTTQQFITQFTSQLFTTQFNTSQIFTTQFNTSQLFTTQFNTSQIFTTQFNTIQSTIQPTPTTPNAESIVMDLRQFPMELVI